MHMARVRFTALKLNIGQDQYDGFLDNGRLITTPC
jgi:hypothetical protein